VIRVLSLMGAECLLMLPFVQMKRFVAAGLLVLIVVGFFAGTLGARLPVHYALVLPLAALLWTAARSRPWARWVAVLAPACALVIAAVSSDTERPVRLLIVFPIAVLLGSCLTHRERQSLARSYLMVAVAVALLALVEHARGSWLFAHPQLAGGLYRNDSLRALVGAEHPLTLGLMLVGAVPLCLTVISNLPLRTLVLACLTAGVWATGSRGCVALIFVAIVLAVLIGSRARMAPWASRLTFAALVSAIGWIAWQGAEDPTHRVLTNSDSEAASSEYRLRLYQAVGDSLSSHPLGWGWKGLPKGQYLLQSSTFGVKDLALTVDSEVVLMVFDFGLVGLLLFAVGIWRSGGARRLADPLNRSAWLMLLGGLFLALHAWIGLGTVLAVIVGSCRAPIEGDPGQPQQRNAGSVASAVNIRTLAGAVPEAES
jgi:hypothetical protein